MVVSVGGPSALATRRRKAHRVGMTGLVVGVDGSAGASHALVWAAEEARLRGWPLCAVLAWDYLDQHHPSLEPRFDPDYSERHAVAALDVYVQQAFLAVPRPEIEQRTVCDRRREL